ncbi:MAG: TetR/AcrR family transcriptional regulator [Bacteroidales bacterium]
MTAPDKENTEEKILEAAKEVFLEKGSDGTRMQEIADRAGINKSLLHYYYRSKEKLFGAVFKFAFSQFLPRIYDIFSNEKDLFVFIRQFVAVYIDTITKNPFIPMFILGEINKNKPGLFLSLLKISGINPEFFRERIKKEINAGKIKPIDPNQLIVNTIGMCVFPFIARPLLEVVLFNKDTEAYDNFIESRKTEVADFIINSIKI